MLLSRIIARRTLRVELREVAVDRHTMLLIGSAIVPVLFIAYMMFGPDGTWLPR
jgi:hypothetical protein